MMKLYTEIGPTSSSAVYRVLYPILLPIVVNNDRVLVWIKSGLLEIINDDKIYCVPSGSKRRYMVTDLPHEFDLISSLHKDDWKLPDIKRKYLNEIARKWP